MPQSVQPLVQRQGIGFRVYGLCVSALDVRSSSSKENLARQVAEGV